MVAVVRIRFAPFLFLLYFVWPVCLCGMWHGVWSGRSVLQFKISAAAAFIGLLPLARAGTTGRLARMIYLSEENGQPPYTYEYLPASHCASFIEAT